MSQFNENKTCIPKTQCLTMHTKVVSIYHKFFQRCGYAWPQSIGNPNLLRLSAETGEVFHFQKAEEAERAAGHDQKLKFNFAKTEFVITAPSRHQNYSWLKLTFDGKEVKQQSHARLLGLQVSWDLTHTWYVSQMKDNLIASLSKRLYVLRRLQNSCTKKCLKNLAHGLIFSKLSRQCRNDLCFCIVNIITCVMSYRICNVNFDKQTIETDTK